MPSMSDEENSDSNAEFKVNNEYAKNYNKWRQKEELHKLKQRYGEEACKLENLNDDSTSDSSSEDEEVEVPEKFEEDFLKVLALLKSDDPKIYDKNVSFFNETNEKVKEGDGKKIKKEKPVTLRDFERKIILERGGKYSDSEDESKFEQKPAASKTYVQEQDEIRNSFKAALEDDEEDENLLAAKPKSKEQIQNEETRKKWLKGQKAEMNPEDEVLKPIRDFWANPNLDEREKFLRDYILDKKYIGNNTSDGALDYDHLVHDSDENLSEDEENIERQEEFEYKYNFRFEEPDQEFIKRYPRTLENTMRKKDTRRSEKRADLKKRKEEEKLRKKEELKELKALKRKEIEEKLEKLKEITGNDDIGINMEDLEGDFDPDEYDKKMQNMFNDEYYTVPEEDMKPQFPDIDEEINAEFNKFQEKCENEEDDYYEEPDCEDPNFIMDADYDPSTAVKSKPESSKKKKKGRNKNSELHKEKPKFDPEVYSTYQEYIDRYYALDYEDMIGDIPCRFKLRKSMANDFGLTVEEILLADDKELNKWCSLKKALEFKPDEVEKREILRFKQKANNELLKQRILKSVYSPEEETEQQEATTSTEQTNKKRKKKKKKGNSTENESSNSENPSTSNIQNISKISGNESSKPQKRKFGDQNGLKEAGTIVDKQIDEVPKKKIKKENQNEKLDDLKVETTSELKTETVVNNEETQKKKKKKKKKNQSNNSLNNSVQSTVNETEVKTEFVNKDVKDEKKEKSQENNVLNNEIKVENTSVEEPKKPMDPKKYQKLMKKKEKRKIKLEKKRKYLKLKNKTNKQDSEDNPLGELASISAERLKAFGTNPKKFKNRLKYGKKN